MHAWRMRRRSDRGAAAVEFALISVPLMLLLLGIIQFGFVFWTQIELSQAAREGARYASLQVPCDATCVANTKAKVEANANSGSAINVADANITVGSNPSGTVGCQAGDTQSKSAVVTVTYKASVALLFTITLTGKASSPCGG